MIGWRLSCGLRYGLLLALTGLAGCNDPQPEPVDAAGDPPAQCGSQFNPATTGVIQGQVVWQGDIPRVPPFRTSPILPGGVVLPEGLVRENPNAPAIDPRTRGVANAVVFLGGVEPKRARPWDLPGVRVEMQDYRFRLRQDDVDSHYGFVRRGDQVEMASRQAVFHSLHADGAAFFGLTFPGLDRPRGRRLEKPGIVELSSAAGYYWMRAYLFVGEHPYYARTDGEGRFLLAQVPLGEYQVICWMPSWIEARHDRDPETGVILRLFFKPPVKSIQKVRLAAGETGEVKFAVSAADFQR